MVEVSQRTAVRGPTLVRLLARLTDVVASESSAPLSDRLSQWLDWKQAVALSRTLDAGPPLEPATPTIDGSEAEECARARAALVGAIAKVRELETGSGSSPSYAPFQQRYLELQRAMLASSGRLRGQLRDKLAGQSPELARLAEVDAIMEVALGRREQTLLARIPVLLGEYFERLHTGTNTPDGAIAASLDSFRRDMQEALLAELEVRFHPVEGLLAALRTR